MIRSAPSMKLLFIFAVLGVFTLVLVSCADDGLEPDYNQPASITIDPIFREYYDELGGEEILGPAISPSFSEGNNKYQYVQSALLVFNPNDPSGQRIQLAPLGMEMNVAEPGVQRPDRPNVRYIDGHIIYPEFVVLYEKLGGARHTGRPISEVHYNPDIKRYEQFFENVGMYILESDPEGKPHLLAYGAWKCDTYCRQQPLQGSQVVTPYRIDEYFVEAVDRLGIEFTGYAITDAYQTPDNYIEQVYANIVLVADPAESYRVFLRPITERLGILNDPLEEELAHPDFSFYPIQNDKYGYNVLVKFWDYIAMHGGPEASGPPITRYTPVRNDVFRQCFKNLCLEARLNESGEITIKPSPMGYQYKNLSLEPVSPGSESGSIISLGQKANTIQPGEELNASTPESRDGNNAGLTAEVERPIDPSALAELGADPSIEVFTSPQSSNQISIQVWESFPMVGQNQSQEIGVMVFENGNSLQGIEPDLMIELPDDTTRRYYMYPTGRDGQTRMIIDPINLPIGTLIPYQVCIFFPGGEKFCVRDSFVIWDNR